MNKISLTVIWMLAVVATVIATVSLNHTRSPSPMEVYDVLFYGWIFLPSLLLAVIAHRVYRRRLPRPWSASMLIASVVHGILYSAMFIRVSFFPGSSTDVIGLLVAPVVTSVAAVFAGWIVHLVFQSRHHENAA